MTKREMLDKLTAYRVAVALRVRIRRRWWRW